jgi:hypothetical protein
MAAQRALEQAACTKYGAEPKPLNSAGLCLLSLAGDGEPIAEFVEDIPRAINRLDRSDEEKKRHEDNAILV